MTNPFSSELFTKIWLKHFNQGKAAKHFEFIEGVSFIKTGLIPYFVNVGKNLTKGVHYNINPAAHDFKNKVFLLYDVPEYFEIKNEQLPKNLGLKSSFQYQGFLMDLTQAENTEDYINSRFSGKNRREFRSNIRRLESCFSIEYEFIEKHIEREAFDHLFDQFYSLLSKRYEGKGTTYHHLASDKWAYYSELVYDMINARMASLLVIRKEDVPIGITLNFHSEDILFETITVFDPDYYKFSIGKTSIIKLLDWCYTNDVKISDFSKGAFDYKEKWANKAYDFNYHIYFDKRSIVARLRAESLYRWFELKRYLREKELNKVYRKFQFLLKGGGEKPVEFKIDKLTEFNPNQDYFEVDIEDKSLEKLRIFAYSFLFANPQPEKELKIYSNHSRKEFILKGSSKCQKIIFS